MKWNLKKIKQLGSLRRLKGLSKKAWVKEKRKAAVFTKIFGENPIGRGIIHQDMNLKWYRHIDKALDGKAGYQDLKHWKRMQKSFKKQMVGVPTAETREIMNWLDGFIDRLKWEAVNDEDREKWLPLFRSYMEDCEHNSADLYIMKNKLME